MPPLEIDDLESAYTVAELAPLFRRTERQVRNMLIAGEIEHFTIGRTRYIPRKAVIDYMERHRIKPPRAPRAHPPRS